MTRKHSSHIPWPHYIDEEEKLVHVHVNSWMTALGASKLVEKWFPGYTLELVSEERLEEVKKETK